MKRKIGVWISCPKLKDGKERALQLSPNPKFMLTTVKKIHSIRSNHCNKPGFSLIESWSFSNASISFFSTFISVLQMKGGKSAAHVIPRIGSGRRCRTDTMEWQELPEAAILCPLPWTAAPDKSEHLKICKYIGITVPSQLLKSETFFWYTESNFI